MPKVESKSIMESDCIFTDRIDEQGAFNELYNNLKEDEYEVLNFWGVPGIGKSFLGQKLQDEVTRRGSEYSYINIDFYKNMKESYEYLEDMAKRLAEKKNYTFPVFCVALSFYYKRRLGERKDVDDIGASFKNQHPFLYKVIEPAVALLGFVSIFGSVSGLISALMDSYGEQFKALLTKHKEELIRIEKYDLFQLERMLPYYFSLDYNSNVCKEKHPMVIFLDTYESHVNELACVGYEYDSDRWLRDKQYGAVPRCTNTLWVITGREQLRWDELDQFWKKKINRYELKDFIDDFSREYLCNVGVTDCSVVAKMLKAVKGVPFHLYLSVEYYHQQLEKGIDSDKIDFGIDYEDIFSKYVQYMKDIEKTIVFLMSCLGKWTKEDFTKTILWKSIGNIMTFNKVHALSFVKSAGNGYFYLHAEAEDILSRKCPDEIKRIYSEYITDKFDKNTLLPDEKVLYFTTRIRDELTPVYISTAELKHSKEESLRKKRDVSILIRSFEDNRQFLEEYLLNKEYPHFEAIISLYLQVVNDTYESTEEEKKVFVEILRYFLTYCIKREWNKNAVDTEEKLISLLISSSSCNYEDVLTEKYRELSIRIALPHNIRILDDIEALYETSKSELGETHIITNGVRILLEYERMVYDRGYSIDVVERFTKEEKRLYGESSPRGVKADINLAYAYKLHEQYEEAILIGEKLLDDMNRWLDEFDIDYMHAIDNLSIAYFAYGDKIKITGNKEKTMLLYMRGYELAKKVYRISSRKVQHSDREKEDHFGYVCRVIHGMEALINHTDGERFCKEALSSPFFSKASRDVKAMVYDAMRHLHQNEDTHIKSL